MSEMLNSLDKCSSVLDSLISAKDDLLRELTEATKKVKDYENIINKQGIAKVTFEKTVHSDENEIHVIFIAPNPDNPQFFRIFGEIKNVHDESKSVKGPLMELKIQPRVKLLKYLEHFFEAYRDYYIQLLSSQVKKEQEI